MRQAYRNHYGVSGSVGASGVEVMGSSGSAGCRRRLSSGNKRKHCRRSDALAALTSSARVRQEASNSARRKPSPAGASALGLVTLLVELAACSLSTQAVDVDR